MKEMDRLSVRDGVVVIDGPSGPAGGGPVALRGINRSGFQHHTSLAQAGLLDPYQEFSEWRQTWRVQILRFPLAQDALLEKAAYLQELDQIVDAAQQAQLYLILELHGTTRDLSLPLPNQDTPLAWSLLAQRYGARQHVVFDLWNEPHDVTWPTWRGIASSLLRVIRQAGAHNTLALVGGVDWAYDLSPLLEPGNRIEDQGPVAYATHPYPFKGWRPHGPAEWDHHFGAVCQDVPVLVTEYGADDSGTRPFGFPDGSGAAAWLRQFHDYVDELGLTVLAWSGGDRPQLTLGRGGGPVDLPAAAPDPGAPTQPFGQMVRDWMNT